MWNSTLQLRAIDFWLERYWCHDRGALCLQATNLMVEFLLCR